ncbi:hypothetical protein SAMN02745163_01193 [Clostridium cavendishii DSM 21758]|uniref:DUF2264 domain-containing protein n=1 Tax=Clostridium cavendishii DSM 21758 TaxID=1121302 RepID=A0A1M6G5T8_9CLOT|nr:DUF2264 domain-containing protein [Clostridium cavendishii]SHJ05299.1 hypothetical protein SAMN02745163_01193 [Clostridium cavendishii DSM 21758]
MENFNLPIHENPLKTKKDLEEALIQICEPLKSYYSKGGALLKLGNSGAYYDSTCAYLEGFSRVLWGLVPLAKGGSDYDLWDTYINGIKNGTNPNHEEYWGKSCDFDQRFVEMAVMGLGLALAPEKMWEPLSEDEKKNFACWLDEINNFDMPDNNWKFFLVFVNTGLRKVGAPYNKNKLNEALERLDKFYIKDGWYTDGPTKQMDYYIAFGMHYYGLIYSKLIEKENPEESKKYKDRGAAFAKDFIYWFSEDGAALPFGRSLTYRFAQCSFWGALVFAGVEVFSYGVIKGIVLRNLRWWFSKPIFSRDGILSIGYCYENLIMGEGYNAPGSPYWAFKSFILLALPENHPFWLAEEEELPKLEKRRNLVYADMLITREENNVIALTAGQDAIWEPAHEAAKYEKFAYSTAFAFSVPKGNIGLVQGAYDSMLALSEEDDFYRVRRRCEEKLITEEYVYSLWKPWNNVVIKTWLIPFDSYYVRIHKINSERNLYTAEGGFSVKRVNNDRGAVGEDFLVTDEVAIANLPWATSAVIDLLGNSEGEVIVPEANTNLNEPRTYIPTLKKKLSKGNHILATAVLGTLDKMSKEQIMKESPKVRIEDNKAVVTYKDRKLIIDLK